MLQTFDSVTRPFLLHDRMVMRIFITQPCPVYFDSQSIKSVAWYHNGTKIISGGRSNISNLGTTLIISNMTESDAGKYEAKAETLLFYSPRPCDKNILKMLENGALYAPLTYVLQKTYTPTYNPEDITLDYAIPPYQGTHPQRIHINNVVMINLSAVSRDVNMVRESLFKDSDEISRSDMMKYNTTLSYYNETTTVSVLISYTNTADIIGHYVHHIYIDTNTIKREECPDYYRLYPYDYPSISLEWNIKLSSRT